MDEKAYDEICQYLLTKQYVEGTTKMTKDVFARRVRRLL